MVSVGVCERIVTDLLNSDSKLRDMLTVVNSDKLIKINCSNCSNEGYERNARAYITINPSEVILCANKLHTKDKIAEALTHEAVHSYDLMHKRYNLDTCDGLAASEIRAAREAECAKRFPWFKDMCIKAHAEAATKNFFPSSGAQCVQRMFEVAVADLEPTRDVVTKKNT